MPEIQLPWGPRHITVTLPDNWQIQQTALPSVPAAPDDWQDRLALALNRPIDGPPLAELLRRARDGNIVIVVEDAARHSPVAEILKILLREIRHAGIENSQLQILLATGMHHRMTPAQVFNKLGPAAAGIRWRSNPWHDPGKYASIGRVGKVEVCLDRQLVQADLRIVISAVAPHLQAGFGGGYKMYLPGCASLDTIRSLHRVGIGTSRPVQLVGMNPQANPMRRVIDAAGQMLDKAGGTTFAVQYLLDERDRPAAVATGDMLSAHRMMAKRCAVACGILVTSPADVLITNAHPLDFDLWQSFKCIPNTLWAVRRGGVIICLSRCAHGTAGMPIPALPLSGRWARRLVNLIGPDSLTSLMSRFVPKLAADAVFFVRLALRTIHRNPVLFVSPVLHERNIRFPGLDIFRSAQEAVDAAMNLLGSGRQRVIVFPSGGTSFPILSESVPVE